MYYSRLLTLNLLNKKEIKQSNDHWCENEIKLWLRRDDSNPLMSVTGPEVWEAFILESKTDIS